MKIRSKLHLTAGVILVTILVSGGALHWISAESEEGFEKIRSVNQINKLLLSRALIREEFLRHHEERPLVQLAAINEDVREFLRRGKALFSSPDERPVLERLIVSEKRIQEALAAFIPAAMDDTSGVFHEQRETMISDQIAIDSRRMVSDVLHLNILVEKQIGRVRTLMAFAFIFIVSMVMLIALSVFSIIFQVLRPMSALHDGIRRIGAGDLEHSLDENRRDEAGEIAREYNKMRLRLRDSQEQIQKELEERRRVQEDMGKAYDALKKAQDASLNIMEDLQMEVANRSRIQQELAQAHKALTAVNAELEKKVAERTRALLETHVELEESHQELKAYTSELERVNKELESFTYTVAHDLRIPLRAIDGFTKILLEEHGNSLKGNAAELFGMIVSHAERMAVLIDSLLTFSRIGRQTIQPVHVDMKQLAADAFHEVSSAGKMNPETVFRLDDLPPAAGDRILLKQVFMNLLSNALKFSASSRPPEISVSGCSKDGENIYAVKDNGVGFDMKYVHKLFGVFQRLHHLREFEGTGVGLAIVARIIERHGGRVWAEAEPGKGAAFFFALPAEAGK